MSIPGSAWGTLAKHLPKEIEAEADGNRVRRLHIGVEAKPRKYTALDLLDKALALPITRDLEELSVGLLRWDDGPPPYDEVLALLARHPLPLKAFSLGIPAALGLATSLEDAGPIAKLWPDLESLHIEVTHDLGMRSLTLPKLSTLALQTNFDGPGMLAFLDQPWPALKTLSLGWMKGWGNEHGPGVAAMKSLDRLLDGAPTPALRALCVSALPKVGERKMGPSVTQKGVAPMPHFITRLASSRLLSQLETLELGPAMLDNDGRKAMEEARPRLGNLKIVVAPSA